MTRTLYLTSRPYERALEYHVGRESLTPNPRAAKDAGVAARSLEDAARAVLKDAGLTVAPLVIAHRLLSAVVRDTAPGTSPDVAQAMALPVRRIFRSGVDLDLLEATASAPVAHLARVARAYSALLATYGYVDQGEVFWRALREGLPPRAVALHGYPRLGIDEQAFVEALAGDGSILLLPYADDVAFAENRELASALRARGWMVRTDDPAHATIVRSPELETQAASLLALPPDVHGHTYPTLDTEVRGTLAHWSQVKVPRLMSRCGVERNARERTSVCA